MSDTSFGTKFFALEGDIFRLTSKSDKLFAEIFDKSTSAFRNVSENFITGEDLMNSSPLSIDDLPPEVREALG